MILRLGSLCLILESTEAGCGILQEQGPQLHLLSTVCVGIRPLQKACAVHGLTQNPMRFWHPHFIDEEIEAQGDDMACLSSLARKWQKCDLNPQSLALKARS